MKECHRIATWLEESVWRELDACEQKRVAAHVAQCPTCRESQRLLHDVTTALAATAADAELEATTVDWNEVNERILQRAHDLHPAARLLHWPRLAAAAAVFLLLSGSAWLFLRNDSGRSTIIRSSSVHLSRPALQRIETTLNEGDTRTYLKSSRMLLSGIMDSCRERPLEAWEAQLFSRQARELLLRQRYLNRAVSSPGDKRVQEIGGRMSWLLMEIATIQPGTSCQRLQEIRGIADRENLLLKLRLLENEMSGGAVEEV